MTQTTQVHSQKYIQEQGDILAARNLLLEDKNQTLEDVRENFLETIRMLGGPKTRGSESQEKTDIIWLSSRKALIQPWKRQSEEDFKKKVKPNEE